MKFENLESGLYFQGPDFIFFFGNKNSKLETLHTQFPNLEFRRLKQTHSALVIESATTGQPLVEADAHFTRSPNIALISVTADCVPILIYDSKTKYVASIHAGWRGVAQMILPKALIKLRELGCQPKDFQIAIGPHIQIDSFEVKKDVKDQILSTILPVKNRHFFELPSGKSKIDLAAVLLTQMEIFQIPTEQIFASAADSFQDQLYHSFRRDGSQAGRQYSFVALSSRQNLARI